MATTSELAPAVSIHGATVPVIAVLGPSVVRVELWAATGTVDVVTPTGRIRCPSDRIVAGESGDGQPFREVAGGLYLDAAERQGIPIQIL